MDKIKKFFPLGIKLFTILIVVLLSSFLAIAGVISKIKEGDIAFSILLCCIVLFCFAGIILMPIISKVVFEKNAMRLPRDFYPNGNIDEGATIGNGDGAIKNKRYIIIEYSAIKSVELLKKGVPSIYNSSKNVKKAEVIEIVNTEGKSFRLRTHLFTKSKWFL
ncbi:MAG: hypothetical protein PHR96_04020 [Clostridia bacterium]|nr:hypothetical protein [Clostridia bacterium]